MIKNIIKADGSIQAFDAKKINRWAQYASKHGGDWTSVVLETVRRLPETTSSSDVHKTMIEVCVEKETIEYSRIAARLEFATIRKHMDKHHMRDTEDFTDLMQKLITLGVWKAEALPPMNKRWNQWYYDIYDNNLEHWQIVQFVDKYGLKLDGKCIETPHLAALGIGLAHHGDSMKAFYLAKAIIEGKVNLPTPALNGGRNGDFDSVSCCVISGGDTIPSIGVADHIAYTMTAKKAGIGIEFHTRTKGSGVKGDKIKHLGKHGIYATVDRSVKMFTQQCYSEDTEILTKEGWKLFKDLNSDCLVAQIHDDRSLEFVPFTTFVEYDLAGDKNMVKFSNRYIDCYVTDNHKMVYRGRKYDTPEETFYGYKEIRADEMDNVRTKLLDFGGKKKGSIEKLSYEDKFRIALQADGTIRLNKTCENSYVFIFNKQRKIDSFLEILKGLGLEQKEEKSTNRGYSVATRPNGNGTATVFRISKVGFDAEKTLSFVYERDFSSAWAEDFLHNVSIWDACRKDTHFEYYSEFKEEVDCVQFVASCCGKYSKIDDKKERATYTVRVCDFDEVTTESINIETVSDYHGKVYCVEVPTHKLVVRRGGKTLVCGNTRGGSATVTFTAIDPEVMEMLLWKTQKIDRERRLDKLDYSFAYNSAFIEAVKTNSDWHLFCLQDAPKVYEAFYDEDAESYNKVVAEHLASGVKSTVVNAQELLKRFLTARQETGRIYCLNVTRTNQHTPFTDRITLSNLCAEIMLPTKPYTGMLDMYVGNSEGRSLGETAFCSLAAINVGRVSEGEYQHVAKVALEAVDSMITKAPSISITMRESMSRRRSAGIGITGLAQYLYNKGMDYDGTEESLEAVSELSERHYFWLLNASQEMAKETGDFVEEGIDLNWLPVDTAVNKKYAPKLPWETLRGKKRRHSVLVAHMPTESSAVFSGAVNGLYPPRERIIYKQSRVGAVQFIIDKKDFIPAWEVPNLTLTKYYSRVQDFSDQGISADYYVVPENFPDGKVPLSILMKEWVAQAVMGVKTMYYVNTKANKVVDMHELARQNAAEEEECGACKL